MGEVYRARDTRLGRVVAVKVLPAHLYANPELATRFTREAQTLSQLNHPSIFPATVWGLPDPDHRVRQRAAPPVEHPAGEVRDLPDGRSDPVAQDQQVVVGAER